MSRPASDSLRREAIRGGPRPQLLFGRSVRPRAAAWASREKSLAQAPLIEGLRIARPQAGLVERGKWLLRSRQKSSPHIRQATGTSQVRKRTARRKVTALPGEADVAVA